MNNHPKFSPQYLWDKLWSYDESHYTDAQLITSKITSNKSKQIMSTLLSLTLAAALAALLIWPLKDAYMLEYSGLSLGHINLPVILFFDSLSLMMFLVVSFIASNVMIFSRMYMQADPHKTRFNWLILSFVTSMVLLIFFPALPTTLLGWDGLGLTSFLLVIYYKNATALSSGMLTGITNLVGDSFMIIGLCLIISQSYWSPYGSWGDEQSYWTVLGVWDDNHSTTYSCLSSPTPYSYLCIMVAACTKSAQIPFSSWLPAAMAAPTPVSALVHSSTLVTAGVFLLIRLYPIMAHNNMFHVVLGLISCTTSLMAGMAAVVETDMKKIIALSTLSQLGVMMSALSMGLPELATFHMITHALFKALLFICAGTMLHLNSHIQDVRMLGSMAFMPVTSSCFFIANITLCAAPFLSAFYSKDQIIESWLYHPSSTIMALFTLTSTAFTAVYSMRLSVYSLWAPSNFFPLNSTSEAGLGSSMPMLSLAMSSIFVGTSLNWTLLEPNAPMTLSSAASLTPMVAAASGAVLGMVFQLTNSSPTLNYPNTATALSSMWFLSPLSGQGTAKYSMNTSLAMTRFMDHGWLELIGPQGVNKSLVKLTALMYSLETKPVTTHVTLCLVGPILIISYYMF